MDEAEFRKLLVDMHGEADEAVVKHYLHTRRHLREGKNVIRVDFEGPAFTDKEIEEINSEFQKVQHQFSYIDESQVAKAHYDYQEIIASIYLSKETYEFIANAIIYPAVWDLIKSVAKKVFDRKEKLKVKVKKDTVCIYISVGKRKSIKFLMKGRFTFDEIDAAMENAMEFSKTVDFSDNGFHCYEISKKGKIKRIE